MDSSGHDGGNRERVTRKSPWGQQWIGNTHTAYIFFRLPISYTWEGAALAVGQDGSRIY